MKNAKVEGDFKLDVSSWEFIWEIGLAASSVRKASVTYWTASLENFYLLHILYICYFLDLIQVPKNSLQVAYCFLFACFCIVSFPLKLGGVGEGGLFFEIWRKRGVMKKILRNKDVSSKGDSTFRKRVFSNCFISFPSKKHAFITIGFFLSGKYSRLL